MGDHKGYQLGTIDIYPASGEEAPSYTSGAHVWNGKRESLNAMKREEIQSTDYEWVNSTLSHSELECLRYLI